MRFEDGGRRLIDLAALARQAEAGTAALAQAQAQPVLESSHLARDGSRRNIHARLGGGKAIAFDDDAEHAQEIDVDTVKGDLRLGFPRHYLTHIGNKVHLFNIDYK
jgi:hypothetical protein